MSEATTVYRYFDRAGALLYVGLTSESLSRVRNHARRGYEIPPRLLNVTDATTYLSISERDVRELISSGQLPYIPTGRARSRYLLDRHDLDDRFARAHDDETTGRTRDHHAGAPRLRV